MKQKHLAIFSLIALTSFPMHARAKVIEVIANGTIQTHTEEPETVFDLRPLHWGSSDSPNAIGLFTWIHTRGSYHTYPGFVG
jgi:hypothetical protein